MWNRRKHIGIRNIRRRAYCDGHQWGKYRQDGKSNSDWHGVPERSKANAKILAESSRTAFSASRLVYCQMGELVAISNANELYPLRSDSDTKAVHFLWRLFLSTAPTIIEVTNR
jgi:hypothetical protein